MSHQSRFRSVLAMLALLALLPACAKLAPTKPFAPQGEYRSVPVTQLAQLAQTDPALRDHVRVEASGPRKGAVVFFEALVAETQNPAGEPFKTTTASIEGVDIFKIDPNRTPLAESAVRFQYPLPGMTTLVVPSFSGGANCCFASRHLTKSDAGMTLTTFDFGKGDGESEPLFQAGKTLMPVADVGLAYYSVEKGKAKFSLSGAESPWFRRHLVFERATWRPDRRNEFAAKYKTEIMELQAELKTNPKARSAAMAMKLAYYALMAGETEAKALEALKKNLPQKALPFAPEIFADVKKQVDGFNPITTLKL